MLRSTKEERQHVLDYMKRQAKDETVSLAQKVYREQLNGEIHDIWDVHTDKARWWVITNPLMNLYSQEQFPNMDLALTFHIGLCVRIPRSERANPEDFPAGPVIAAWRKLDQANQALSEAEEVADFQAVGVRCREALIALISVAQDFIEVPSDIDRPKRADVRAWSDIIANVILVGEHHQARRQFAKALSVDTWTFVNWLTHAQEAHVYDADTAAAATELTLGLFTTAFIRHIRGVPDRCPVCGSQRLSPELGYEANNPSKQYERPVCEKCGWTGEPVEVKPPPPRKRHPSAEGECVFMTTPLIRFPESPGESAIRDALRPKRGKHSRNTGRNRK